MDNKRVVIIDLAKWQTQTDAAINYNGKGCSPEYISKLIATGKIEVFNIPELRIKLVSTSHNVPRETRIKEAKTDQKNILQK